VNGADGVFSPVHGALACRPAVYGGADRAPKSRGTPQGAPNFKKWYCMRSPGWGIFLLLL
jgi:hypothetical protein